MTYRTQMLRVAIAVIWLVGLPLTVSGHGGDSLFPRYPRIEPNVEFWTQIYSHYTTTQAVVHDSVQLDRIYDVIELLPTQNKGARKINRQRMKAARLHYEKILKRLAADPDSADADSRPVAARFGRDAGAGAFKRASHRVRCQIGQRDRFRSGVIRSGAYLKRIREIFNEYGLPEDLAYLPHVESSFDLRVTSKSGAAGMWQFTRSTGRRFLTVNHICDERRDPIAATYAAARLLKENFEKLGSWPLAITAYNHGAAGMQRAKARHGDYPTIFTSYRSRTFKFASRNFYTEFLAARQVAANYERYFGELPLDVPPKMRSVRLEGFVAWSDLLSHFGVSARAARAMNPALRPPVFNGQKFVPKGYVLNLPVTDARELAVVPAAMQKNTQRPSRFYTVQAGDTAGKIARMHRVRLADLILANNLNRQATVYLNQRLRIPKNGGAKKSDAIQQPTASPSSTSPRVTSDHAPIVMAALPVAGNGRYYRRPGPSPAQLLALEEGYPEPAASAAKAAITEPVMPATVSAQVAINRVVKTTARPIGVITVDVEETLGHYAEWAGVSAHQLRRMNRLSRGHALRLHQEIKIPLDKVSRDRFEARRHAFHKKLQTEFFASYRIGELQQYRVQPGDSYWSLCHKKFDLPLWLLRYYNAEVNLADLRVHQALTIPAVVSIVDGTEKNGSPDA